MRACASSITDHQNAQHKKNLFYRLFQLAASKAVKAYLQHNMWWMIGSVGIAVILLETAEHLLILENRNFFYYSELTLITSLLIVSGLIKSAYLASVQEKANCPVDPEPENRLLEQKIQAIQLEIARDLHDTIGQNIGYLRMQLERMAESGAPSDPAAEQEIRRMSEVANESYDLMRGTMAALQAKDSAGLQRLLSSHAHLVAERTSMLVEVNAEGEPRPVAPGVMRQVFYIFREVMCNIEKHAQASLVSIQMTWTEQRLTLSVSDNGRGFDPALTARENHYGLKFMRQRVAGLKGELEIKSAPEEGTRIAVHIPL